MYHLPKRQILFPEAGAHQLIGFLRVGGDSPKVPQSFRNESWRGFFRKPEKIQPQP